MPRDSGQRQFRSLKELLYDKLPIGEVEAMLFHTALVAVALLDEVKQGLVEVKCAQAAPEHWWRWWLTLSVGILGPLLSTAGSIYVASKVFRWQGTKERETWVRDQERAEWGAILSSLTAVEVKMPHVFPNSDWIQLTSEILDELRAVLPVMRNAVLSWGNWSRRSW